MTPESLTAVILAGGFGTRLKPVLKDRPKILAEVMGRPFIYYLLKQLEVNQIKKVILCTGYKAHQVKETLGNSYGHVQLHYSQEYEPMGTGGALRLSLPLISSNIILVMNGDSFLEFNLHKFLEEHLSRTSVATILLTKVNNSARFGRITIDNEGQITGFIEKDGLNKPGLINAGIYLMAKKTLNNIPEGKNLSLEKDIFPLLIGKGLYGYINKGRFIDIGTPESYLYAQNFFRKSR